METGRLIRVSKFRGDPQSVAYIVAMADAGSAIELIRAKVVTGDHDIEDLGRVSEALLIALKLQPGEFMRA